MTTSVVVKSGEFILRRVQSNGVVMASLHPVIGPLYWYFIDESDCDAPDYYGLTDCIEDAMLFSKEYEHSKENAHCGSRRGFLGNVLNGAWNYEEDFCGNLEDAETIYDWKIMDFAEKTGVTPSEFVEWVSKTTWVEYPAPQRITFLSDFNGFVGYRAEWTDDPGKAIKFSQSEIDENDPDVMLAKGLGKLVPVEEPFSNLPVPKAEEDVNYAQLADVDFTFHRLCLDELKIDYKERALAQAANAGRQSANFGNTDISPHLKPFPELVAAFKMGVELETFNQATRSCLTAL